VKRFIAILATALYTVLSLGLVIHIHYCGGELAHVSILAESNSCCESATDCCATQISCCENKEFRIAIDEVHQPTIGVETPQFLVGIANYTSNYIVPHAPVAWSSHISTRGSPPDSTPIYISLCRLTYYG